MVYKIKKGNHYSFHWPKLFWSKKMDIEIEFLSNPSYISRDSQNQEDINKIYGFSDSWNHHINSVRIGWYFDEKLQQNLLVAYLYKNGVRKIYPLGNFEINQPISIYLEIEKDFYILQRKGVQTTITKRESRWWGPRYILFPYFRGQEVSDKDYIIKIT